MLTQALHADDRALARARLFATAQLMLVAGDEMLRTRLAEMDEALADLVIAHDRAVFSRWRVLLACGRIARAQRLAARVADCTR
jgi:hypothetical protein